MENQKAHVSFYLSLKRETYDDIKKLAEKNGRTLTAQVRILLERLFELD